MLRVHRPHAGHCTQYKIRGSSQVLEAVRIHVLGRGGAPQECGGVCTFLGFDELCDSGERAQPLWVVVGPLGSGTAKG